MSHRRSGLHAGALALLTALALVPAAGATPVTVRIVGDGVALDATPVQTTGAAAGACAGNTAGEAIDKAVAGDWDQMAFTSTILGETHDYSDSDYWNFWINDTYSQAGICAYVVQPGDRVLMLVQRDVANAPTVFPLTLTGVPASVVAGSPFTVTVNEQRTDGTATTPTPIAGASVTDGAGFTAVTGAGGHATITLPSVGPKTLYAVRRGNVESESTVVNVVGADTTTLTTTGPPVGSTAAGPVRSALSSAIVGLAEGDRFAPGEGPRELKVKASAGAGLLIVKLRLTRNDRGKCSTFSGKSERFRHVKCGAANGFWFGVGDRTDTSYLLPSRLARGRYVLDVNAIDKAYNRDDARRRGGNRVVFYVG
jgi:hypothetical protein